MSASRIVTISLVCVAVALILLSGSFGRAHPTGSYRPDLPPAALTNGCWPLPDGVVLGFPHQVRSDGEAGDPPRRHLVLQFDEIDAVTARHLVEEAFRVAGFVQSSPAGNEQVVFEKPGVGAVTAEVTPLSGAGEEYVVRGTIVLDLPSSPSPLVDAPVCDEPFSTKRFDAEEGVS